MTDKKHTIGAISLVMTLGIVFGDIGTSPLYVMATILRVNPEFNADYIIGAVSCVIWTLALQTSLKYVLIALRADNHGEGGILSLFSLLKKSGRSRWLYVLAIIGASTLVADGVITPAITVTSAVEGLCVLNPNTPIVAITILIILFIFALQVIGTKKIGGLFGPVMLVWFLMLGVMGSLSIGDYLPVLKAFNPAYAIRLLIDYPGWLLVVGAIFLCTTGAEALYSDLGHCGRKNITITWCFVKTMLILNYLGQGAWIIAQPHGTLTGVNPFYGIMPPWFTAVGIVLATLAAIIASQALLSGSFTLFSEAVNLNFFPRLQIKYPSDVKGQLFIPAVNMFLLIGCLLTIILFRDSSHMEAAYGLAITITMLMTTILLIYWMKLRKVNPWAIGAFGVTFGCLESMFLIANAVKFAHGGWFALMIAAIVATIMLIWRKAEKVRNSLIEYHDIDGYIPIISALRTDETIPITASNIVYFSKATNYNLIESKLIYSIINKDPKRAARYWLLHVDFTDNPNTLDYDYRVIIPDAVIRINLRMGFRIRPQVTVYFRQIVEDLTAGGIISQQSIHPSIRRFNIPGNFRFVIIHRVFSPDSNCSQYVRTIMWWHNVISHLGIGQEKALGLDTSNVTVENVPLIISNHPGIRIVPRVQ